MGGRKGWILVSHWRGKKKRTIGSLIFSFLSSFPSFPLIFYLFSSIICVSFCPSIIYLATCQPSSIQTDLRLGMKSMKGAVMITKAEKSPNLLSINEKESGIWLSSSLKVLRTTRTKDMTLSLKVTRWGNNTQIHNSVSSASSSILILSSDLYPTFFHRNEHPKLTVSSHCPWGLAKLQKPLMLFADMILIVQFHFKSMFLL